MKLLFWSWERETWRAFWRRPSSFVPSLLAIVSLLLNWFIASRMWQMGSVIMRYSIYVGANWLAAGKWIVILPATATVIVVLDLVLAYAVTRASLVLRYLWLWSAVFVSVGSLWLSWLLFRINV